MDKASVWPETELGHICMRIFVITFATLNPLTNKVLSAFVTRNDGYLAGHLTLRRE